MWALALLPFWGESGFLKRKAAGIYAIYRKSEAYAGAGCPAQTSCAAGALPFSWAELTCAAGLKDSLGHSKDLGETGCFFFKSTHPALSRSSRATALALEPSCLAGSDVRFLYKPLYNRKRLWFFFCCSGFTIPGVLLCSAYGFLLICCERQGSVEVGFFCSALLYSAVKPYASLTVSHKILRASVITNFTEAVVYQLCDFPAGSNKRSQVPVKCVGTKPFLSGSILRSFPSLFP